MAPKRNRFRQLWERALDNEVDAVRTVLLTLTPDQRYAAQHAAGIITNEYDILCQEAADDDDATPGPPSSLTRAAPVRRVLALRASPRPGADRQVC